MKLKIVWSLNLKLYRKLFLYLFSPPSNIKLSTKFTLDTEFTVKESFHGRKFIHD